MQPSPHSLPGWWEDRELEDSSSHRANGSLKSFLKTSLVTSLLFWKSFYVLLREWWDVSMQLPKLRGHLVPACPYPSPHTQAGVFFELVLCPALGHTPPFPFPILCEAFSDPPHPTSRIVCPQGPWYICTTAFVVLGVYLTVLHKPFALAWTPLSCTPASEAN